MPVFKTNSLAVPRLVRTRAQNTFAAFPLRPRSRSVPPTRSSAGPSASCSSAFARRRASAIWEAEVGRVYELDYYSGGVANMNAQPKTSDATTCCCCGPCCCACGCCAGSAETRAAGGRNALPRREPGRRPRQEAAVDLGQLLTLRSTEPRVFDVLLIEGRHVLVAEARDRHVQDVLGEDPMRIRLAFGGNL